MARWAGCPEDLHDRYGRVLAYVYADNVLVNQALARRGFARVAVYPPNVGLIDAIRAAADSARAERLGVWRGGGRLLLVARQAVKESAMRKVIGGRGSDLIAGQEPSVRTVPCSTRSSADRI
jgi:endonuclease YncB( thermonuclease family)